ncbi:carbohydrate-binding protein [Marivirga lumbricoides]|uniref:carbohydrate-binding protein n=1 Tax=Marivirga lumbricoides TaxID=1046115 RepID=UPI003CD08A8F
MIATVEINTTTEEGIWSTFKSPVTGKIKGVHSLYFIFRGEKDLFYFDWWKFK